jgi:DNA-binding NarL/FixJ family response regulator
VTPGRHAPLPIQAQRLHCIGLGLRDMNASAEAPILIIVDDLLFASKISETASRLRVAVEAASMDRLRSRLGEIRPNAVIIDLNHRSGRAVEAVRALKADRAWSGTVCGFVSHVQSNLIEAAREAGCDLVLARSAFAQDLPQLLARLANPAGKPSPQT